MKNSRRFKPQFLKEIKHNMKKRFLSFGILLAATGFAITFLSTPEATYTSIENRSKKQEHGIDVSQEYLADRKANKSTGKVNLLDVQKAREQVILHKAIRSSASILEWEEMGPDNVGGRTRAVLIDKDNPSRIYAGAVSGGLWISESGGRAWRKYSDELGNLNISCITQASNGDIYFGTGELYFAKYSDGDGSSGFVGNGVWKKEANSSEFIHLASTDLGAINNNDGADWASVNELATDPNDPSRVYAATSGGLQVSDDGGQSWTVAGAGPIQVNAIDVQVAADGSYVLAVAGTLGGNKIYKSTSGDAGSFILHHNFAASDNVMTQVGRIQISISPSNTNILYCTVSDDAGNGNMKGVFRSEDKGESWEMIAYPGFDELNIMNGQARYSSLLAVHPTNPDKVYVGGLDLWKWEKGSNWEKLTQWFYSYYPTFTDYLHADQHTMVFNPNNPDVLYVGNDGGVFRSEDGGSSFRPMNKGYNVTQFYALGFSPHGEVIGGTQDNGTQMVGWKPEFSNSGITQGVTPQSGMKVKGGDGGFAEMSRINSDIMFVESQFSTDVHSWLQRTRDKGLSLEYSNNDKLFLDAFVENYLETNGAPFITPFTLWENPNDLESRDSITFVNETTAIGVGAGDGVSYSFSGVLEASQDAAEIDYSTLRFYSGDMEVIGANSAYWSVEFDTLGNAIDSVYVTSVTDVTTGDFTVDFGEPASLNVPVLASFETSYSAGDILTIQSSTLELPLTFTLIADLESGDSVRIQDPVQSKFFLGASMGTWMTRDALDLSGEGEWMQIANTSWSTRDIDWSVDGNYCFIASGNSVFRVSRLRYADDKAHGHVDGAYYVLDQLSLGTAHGLPSGQAATGVYVDKKDANRVVVTFGNYGNTNYVFASTNALADSPNFISIQGDLPQMPVYDALINAADSSQIFLATEFGVWSASLSYANLPTALIQTDNFDYIQERIVYDVDSNAILTWDTIPTSQTVSITQNLPAQNPTWTPEDMGLGNVPIFTIRQQYYPGDNYGQIYIATHGRGMYKSGSFVARNDEDLNEEVEEVFEEEIVSSMHVYPNPVSNQLTIDFISDLTITNVDVNIYDLTGKLVIHRQADLVIGSNQIPMDVSTLPKGTYLVHFNNGIDSQYAKIVKAY